MVPQIEHGKFTKWNWLVLYPEHLRIGKGVDIGALTFLNAKQGIVLEDNVQIGPHCVLTSISTIDGRQGQIRICEGAKIGALSMIMPGITIGPGAVVGACSFVNRDVPGKTVAYGTPCRVRNAI